MKIPFLDFYRDRQAEATDRYTLFQSKDQLFTEQYKNFCARFEYAVDVRGCKVVAISSAIAGEGKTVSTVNLAANLASTGRKKVLLIDLDLRKSDLAKGLRFPSTPGMVELLGGSASLNEVLRFVITQGLHVIPSGKRVSNRPGGCSPGRSSGSSSRSSATSTTSFSWTPRRCSRCRTPSSFGTSSTGSSSSTGWATPRTTCSGRPWRTSGRRNCSASC